MRAGKAIQDRPAGHQPAGDGGPGSSRRRQNDQGKRKDEQPDSRYGSRQVAAVEEEQPAASGGSRRQRTGAKAWQPKLTFEQMLDAPCKHHSGAKPSTHTTRQCSWTQRLMRGDALSASAFATSPAAGSRGRRRPRQIPHQDAAYIVFTSEGEDKRSLRRRAQEVNAIVPPVPQFMHWSEKPITWGREDHPAVMPTPGGYALVLDPTFVSERLTCRFSRVLVDGGSSINILYRDTMLKLGIKESQLQPSRTVFHGIVPGHSCSPIGKIRLDVLFGTKDHFRREPIWFEVVDLNSPYHALLGRPALAKFMAVPHYAYLKLKLPGPKGIITIAGDYKKSLECAAAGSKLAESLVIAEERRQLDRLVALSREQPAMPEKLKQPAEEAAFQPSKDTKRVPLDPANPGQYVVVGTRLDSK